MSIFRWIVIQLAVFVSIYLGFVWGQEGALNVLQFYCWTVFVVSFAVFSDNLKQEFIEQYNKHVHIPRRLDVIVDLLVVGILVWFGWGWTGGAFFLHICITQHLFTEPKKEAEPQ